MSLAPNSSYVDDVLSRQHLLPSTLIDGESNEGSVEAGDETILVSVRAVISLVNRAKLGAKAFNFLLSGIAMAAVGVTINFLSNSGRSC